MSRDIFWRRIYQTYEKCSSVVGTANDIQVFGNDETNNNNIYEKCDTLEMQALSLTLIKKYNED